MSTFWERSRLYPPILVRLLARHRHGAPLTDQEIACSSGLTLHEVGVISASLDWSCTSLTHARQFLVACGVDFESRAHMVRVRAYLHNRPTWKYLRVHPLWESQFKPLVIRYQISQQKG